MVRTVRNSLGLSLSAVWFLAMSIAEADPKNGTSYEVLFPDVAYHQPRSDDVGALPGDRRPFCVQHISSKNGKQLYTIGFIEFDQHGDYWDRDQLAINIHQMKRAAEGGKQILLIEYVHGWHHNSQEDAGRDVASFKILLDFLARSPFIQDSNYVVYGVYLGWRGEMVRNSNNPLTLPLWIPHELSFYPEKHIGTELSTTPMMSEAIFQLVHTARTSGKRAHTVLIGHSFGAMVLEDAIAQAIAAEAVAPPGPDSNNSATPPADLVLLLNSAANSLRAKGLVDMFRRMPRAENADIGKPLIVSVTSETDSATGTLFPLGTGLANLFRHYRTYEKEPANVNQKYYITHTPGHNKFLQSHEVETDDNTAPATLLTDKKGQLHLPASFSAVFERNLTGPLDTTGKRVEQQWRFHLVPKNGGESTSRIYFKGSQFTRYWVVHVPHAIINTHGDIFNDQALCLYATIFRINNANATTAKEAFAPQKMTLPTYRQNGMP
jgi:hypothetical protein